MAAFQNVDDSLLIFRSFNHFTAGYCKTSSAKLVVLNEPYRARILLTMPHLTYVIRLLTVEHVEGWDPAKKLLFRELEAKLQLYGGFEQSGVRHWT